LKYQTVGRKTPTCFAIRINAARGGKTTGRIPKTAAGGEMSSTSQWQNGYRSVETVKG